MEDIAQYVNEKLRDDCYCVMPPGEFKLSEPIRFPFKSGVQLHGAGKMHPNARVMRNIGGRATRLHCDFDGPSVIVTGEHMKLSGFCLDGGGILFTKKRRGLGVGKGVFEDILINNCDTGIQIGESYSTNNCDSTEWNRIYFTNCDTAVRQVNQMAMGHHWHRPTFYAGVNKCFVVDAGGHCVINLPLCTFGPTLLTFTGRWHKRYRTGANSRQWTVNDLKVDANNRGKFKFIVCEDTNGADIVINRGMVSGPNPWSFGTVLPGTKITNNGLQSHSRVLDYPYEVIQ